MRRHHIRSGGLHLASGGCRMNNEERAGYSCPRRTTHKNALHSALPLHHSAHSKAHSCSGSRTVASSALSKVFMLPVLLLCVLLHQTAGQTLRFQWVTGTWGPCQHSSCGEGGIQFREVRCQMPSGQPVMPDNCESTLRPPDTQECFKPCSPHGAGAESPSRGGRVTTTPRGPPRRGGSGGSGRDSNRGEGAGGEGAWRQEEVILNPPRLRPSEASAVEWVVSQWRACQLQPGASSCGRTRGVRYRNVTCERKDRRVQMDDYLCQRVERRPPSSEPCELLCRQDCIVTGFSSWSSCDVTCQVTNRTRTRNIVVPPRHRGDHCPSFSEMLPCDNCSETFSYRLGDWGGCTLIGSNFRDVKSHYLIGHQSREISCLQSKGTLTTLGHCREKVPDALLYRHQSCVIPQDCRVSAWSALRSHNSSCVRPDGSVMAGFMIHTREVLQLPMGEGLACPTKLVELVQLEDENPSSLAPCKRAKWIMSSWSVCTTVPGYSNCGTGIQSRRAICVSAGEDGVERPVDEVLCPQPKPLVSQVCQTDCNWDCSVSQWSSWSTCQNGACSQAEAYDFMIRRRRRKRVEGQVGKRYRTREILTLPGPGGRACPHLSEIQACEPQPCFKWHVTYGTCEATPRGGCGQGTRQRVAECVDKEGKGVKASFCWEHQTDNRPWEECYVPCPDDCVLSDWGTWSPCPDPCDLGQSGPAVRKRVRRVLAYSGTGSKVIPCPNPSTLQQTEQCPAPLECTVYLWKTSAWHTCTVIDASTKCGRGTQTREVACYSARRQRAVAERCEERIKPLAVQDCMVKCPVDCHVTEWSDWSHCGTSCRAYTDRQLLPKQSRRRHIVTYPQNGGLSCPNVLNEERQCLDLPVCETFYWDVSDWGDCILPPIVPTCGNGLRARNVTCRHSNATEYRLNVCLERLSNLPLLVEPCYVACPSECQLSEWEPWGRCVQGCQGKKFRWRKLLGDSKTNPDCKNQNKYPLDEQEECVCDSLRPVVIGGWSDCILKPQEEVGAKFAQMSLKSLQQRTTNDSRTADTPKQAYCGLGVRYKAISCQTSARDMEGAASCSATEYREEECVLPCPVDCKMSPWTAWSTCSLSCGTGIQKRFRSIQTLPQNGGRKCPPLYGYSRESQTRVCVSSCQYHRWNSEDWGPCMPYGESVCGPGTQARSVGCYSVSHSSTTLTLVDSSYCRQLEKPDTRRDCSLPCPGDCVLSDWTQWSSCTQPCNGRQTQKRSRVVLRYADQYSSNDCSTALQETRVCIKGDNCFEYTWELSDWTSCLINDGSEACGVGHKERYALCRDDSGQRVPDMKCTELFGPMTEPLVVSCEIPCDNDCLLSDWSDWSMCSDDCGLGKTTRYRTTVQAPLGNGRKCPDNMEESRPCFKQGCYRWQVTKWSACRTQTGVCGSGLQVRNVSCVGQDGMAANTSRCPHDTEKLVLKTRRACHVPCPGECRLADWSPWARCYISCEDFEQGFRTGVMSRSRAVLAYPSPGNTPCGENLWQEKSCQTQTCSSFGWVARPWGTSTRRSVSCQRSDGLVVEGGCPRDQKPAAELKCQPSCDLPNSHCIDSNLCGCLGEYQPVYTANRTLTACTMNASSSASDITTAATEASSATSPWMYAVIAVGTVIVISISAALYNMCELFRTGPRPRRNKGGGEDGGEDGKGDGVSDTRSGARTPVVQSDTSSAKKAQIEEMYKQCHPPARPSPLTPSSAAAAASAAVENNHQNHQHHNPHNYPLHLNNIDDPAYQNMEAIDADVPDSLPRPSPATTRTTPAMAGGRPTLPTQQQQPPTMSSHNGRGRGVPVAAEATGGRTAPKHVGRLSMRLACSPEETEQLLLPPSPSPSSSLLAPRTVTAYYPAHQYACADHDGSSDTLSNKSHNRLYPAWQNSGQGRGGGGDGGVRGPRAGRERGGKKLGLLSACFRGSGRRARDHEDYDDDDEDEVKFKQKLFVSRGSPSSLPLCSAPGLCAPNDDSMENACVEVHINSNGVPLSSPNRAQHLNCMLPHPDDDDELSPTKREQSLSVFSQQPASPQYISSARTFPHEDMELGDFSLGAVEDQNKPDLKNRGSLSNISEISFDRPLSESSLKLGITAEILQAAMIDVDGEGIVGTLSPRAETTPTVIADVTAESETPSVSVPDDPPNDVEEDTVCEDPRILELLRPKKGWSLDSGRSTLPPSRNGSLETASDSSNWAAANGKRPGGSSATLPHRRDSLGSRTFRQSLDKARAARKNANSLPLTLPQTSSAHPSPSVSGPSSLASNSPSLRHHPRSSGSRLPSGVSSPDSRSVCDSCRKVIGPGGGDLSYTSDTPDSLSEMSDRSGMETTV